MKTLIVYVAGISGHPNDWNPLVAKLRAEPELQNADWLPIDHHCSWNCKTSFDNLSRDIEDRIAAEVTRHPEVEEIILVGHSLGGQFVRKAFMLAAERSREDAASPRRWDTRVKRIVLLASINRGIDPRRSVRMRLGLLVMRLVYPLLGRTIVFDLLPGSRAVLTLRLEWMRHFARLNDPPMIVQVLGRNDSEVSREDVEDTEQFPNAYHLSVPGADHVHLYNLNSTSEPELHYDMIRRAFVDWVPPGEPKLPRTAYSKVIFLLHGIRATAHGWPRQLEREIQSRDPSALVVRPSTGYFTALRFAVPRLHKRALRWFQDQYGQLVAKYPDADFHFVGHSNGTYLMGQSLNRIPSIEFGRVFLGGCVLPQDFQWPQRFSAGQIGTVVNAFTPTDKVVGFLCSALRGAGRKDVGTAGYESFTTTVPGKLLDHECNGVGHSAAFNSPAKLAWIAAFILGQPTPALSEESSKPFPRIFVQAARFTWIFIAVLFAFLLWIFGWSTGGLVIAGTLVAVAFILTII